MTTLQEPAVRPSNGAAVARGLLPVAIDVAVPIAVYVLARSVFGATLIDALVLSSVVPVVRTLVEFACDRRINALAVLMLTINLAGIALTFFTGNVRLGSAKSAGIGAVVAIGFLVSVARGRPVLSEGMRPFVTRGDDARETAWVHLRATSDRFRLMENRFTLIYGGIFLADSLARLVVAVAAPVSLLGWLPNVLFFVALAAAVIVSGGAAVDPIVRLLDAEVRGDGTCAEVTAD